MTAPICASQVTDDPDLLSLMMSDAAEAPREYRPTNYWSVYEQRLLPELHRRGLHDFRRRTASVLASFGATDLRPSPPRVDLSRSRLAASPLRRLPYWPSALAHLSRALAPLPISGGVQYDDYRKLAFDFAELYGEFTGARPLRAVGMSLAGAPEDTFEVEGHAYSLQFVTYYMRYAYCAQFCNFSSIGTIAELGSGGGAQIELLKKFYPDLTIFAFDIPPQLYVCETYLKAVFPECIVSYRDARLIEDLGEIPRGSIAFLGSWQFPLIANGAVDLFWNAASFQEMEPDVVANYLHFVSAYAGAAYLCQAEHGQHVAVQPGLHGVLERTTFDHYRNALASLELVDSSFAREARGLDSEYRNGFWIRPCWAHARA